MQFSKGGVQIPPSGSAHVMCKQHLERSVAICSKLTAELLLTSYYFFNYLLLIQLCEAWVPLGCLQFVIVVFPDHTHLLFWGGG